MKIRAKVIISLIHRGQVLMSEGVDPVREIPFYIPVGGGVEFGETLLEAANRELSEELGVTGQDLEFLNFHEFIFEYGGRPEHEIMFHYLCEIDEPTKEAMPETGTESDGSLFSIGWLSQTDLKAARDQLVPPLIFDDLVGRLL